MCVSKTLESSWNAYPAIFFYSHDNLDEDDKYNEHTHTEHKTTTTTISRSRDYYWKGFNIPNDSHVLRSEIEICCIVVSVYVYERCANNDFDTFHTSYWIGVDLVFSSFILSCFFFFLWNKIVLWGICQQKHIFRQSIIITTWDWRLLYFLFCRMTYNTIIIYLIQRTKKTKRESKASNNH